MSSKKKGYIAKNYRYENIRDIIIEELWQNAIFDSEALSILEEIAALQSNKELSLENVLSLISSRELHSSLSTLRNRHLITIAEQEKIKKKVVGFFGLSVGSHAALAWMMESRAEKIKIVDPAIIKPTNLNRMQASWQDIGKRKVDLVVEQLQKINPYAKVFTFYKGDESEINRVFEEEPTIDAVVDEIDDIEAKIILRRNAKKYRIPLVSAADVGDNVTLDIERYDKNPQPRPFLGRVVGIEEVDLDKLSDIERKRLIIKLVGFANNSERMLDSLLEIGKSLATWPQLAATAVISGGVVVTALKKIFLGEKVKSGRYFISLDKLLVPDFDSHQRVKRRREKARRVEREMFK